MMMKPKGDERVRRGLEGKIRNRNWGETSEIKISSSGMSVSILD